MDFWRETPRLECEGHAKTESIAQRSQRSQRGISLGHFPSDEAATKLIYLALRNITKKWKKPPVTWKLAATELAIRFGQRFFAVEI